MLKQTTKHTNILGCILLGNLLLMPIQGMIFELIKT